MNTVYEDEAGTPFLFSPVPEEADPATAEKLVALYEETIAALPAVSALTLAAYGDAVEQIKKAERQMETIRKEKVAPYNAEATAINAAYMPFVKKFGELWRKLSEAPNRFLAEQRQVAHEAQRKLNAIADATRMAEARKGAADRAAAEAALRAGKMEDAARLDALAERHDLKAAAVVAPIVEIVSKKIDTGSASVGFSGGKKVWSLPGWDGASKLYGTDPLLYGIDPAWLLRFCVVDAVRLNQAYKGGEKFPTPFAERIDYSGATSRGRK